MNLFYHHPTYIDVQKIKIFMLNSIIIGLIYVPCVILIK